MRRPEKGRGVYRNRKTGVTWLLDRCKQGLKYRNEIDEKDTLWVTMGKGRAERNSLNV